MKLFWTSVLMLLLHHQGFSQVDSTIKRSIDTIQVGNMTIVRSLTDSSFPSKPQKDTIRISGGVVIIGSGLDKGLEKIRIGGENIKNAINDMNIKVVVNKTPKKYSTNWFAWDLGFAGYNDETNYASRATQNFLAPIMGTNFPTTPPLSKNDFKTQGNKNFQFQSLVFYSTNEFD